MQIMRQPFEANCKFLSLFKEFSSLHLDVKAASFLFFSLSRPRQVLMRYEHAC